MVFTELTTYDTRIPSPVRTVLLVTRALCVPGPSPVPPNVRFLALLSCVWISGTHPEANTDSGHHAGGCVRQTITAYPQPALLG